MGGDRGSPLSLGFTPGGAGPGAQLVPGRSLLYLADTDLFYLTLRQDRA